MKYYNSFIGNYIKRSRALQKIAGDVIQFPLQTQPMPEQKIDNDMVVDIIPKPKFDDFVGGYIEAALFVETDENGHSLNQKYSMAQIDNKTLQKIIKDCEKFQRDNEQDLNEYYEIFTERNAGQDFYFTRQRVGTGYWDRVPGKLGESLTLAAKKYPEQDLYVGDDNKIYGA